MTSLPVAQLLRVIIEILARDKGGTTSKPDVEMCERRSKKRRESREFSTLTNASARSQRKSLLADFFLFIQERNNKFQKVAMSRKTRNEYHKVLRRANRRIKIQGMRCIRIKRFVLEKHIGKGDRNIPRSSCFLPYSVSYCSRELLMHKKDLR